MIDRENNVIDNATMGYSAKAIANYFLTRARDEGTTITPLKIQKLVYLAHGWYLGFTSDPLVDDEYAEAWPFGPVFPSLYHEFKEYGSGSIKELATDLVYQPTRRNQERIVVDTPEVSQNDEESIDCLRNVWEKYGPLTGGQLSTITHKKGSPWTSIRSKSNPRRNQQIPDETIEKYYKNIIEKL